MYSRTLRIAQALHPLIFAALLASGERAFLYRSTFCILPIHKAPAHIYVNTAYDLPKSLSALLARRILETNSLSYWGGRRALKIRGIYFRANVQTIGPRARPLQREIKNILDDPL